MKKIIIFTVLNVMVTLLAWGQSTPTGQKTLAATMNVYVFPTEGQDSGQQSKDEAECYNWAVQNTETDPFELQAKNEQAKQQAEQTKQQAAQATQGAGAKGAFGPCRIGRAFSTVEERGIDPASRICVQR